MLCELACLDNEEKEGDNISGNRLINLKISTTNKGKVFVCQKCAQEKDLQMKLEEERYQESFIYYVETYYYLTLKN